MEKVTIWHNTKCSKSKKSMCLLEEHNLSIEVREYLTTPPTKDELVTLLSQLGMTAKELMRTGETVYKELNLQNIDDETALIEAMIAHPILIERPIVVKNNKAVIGRPLEKVAHLLA